MWHSNMYLYYWNHETNEYICLKKQKDFLFLGVGNRYSLHSFDGTDQFPVRLIIYLINNY